MTTVVTAVYPDLAATEAGIARLVAAGFPRDAISVIVRDTPDHQRKLETETGDTARGALVGAVGGGVLASLAFATLALPPIGVLTAGPLLAAVLGGTGGAIAGGVVGVLTGHGISTMSAQEYETAIDNGHAVVAVHTTHDLANRAKRALRETGAGQIYDSVHFGRSAEGGD